MIVTVLTVYLAIGCAVLVVGPIKREIACEMEKTRGQQFAKAVLGRPQMSERRLLAFRLGVSFGAALVWPVALVSVLRQQAYEAEQRRERKQRRRA
jgi:hypothetical protein